jgi:hypothetical protein
MKDETANLSIDFLIGFTIFILAFIWVATMLPGLLIGISGYAIDYDAVAYRSGVILVEDPGMPANPPWENIAAAQKDDIQRMGLALTKESPNILSPVKINRFFSPDFAYPDDYQEKVIFGDHPYQFNVSIMTFDNTINQSVGDIRPKAYGYIRRFVKVKQMSNVTIDVTHSRNYKSTEIAANHTFSINLSMPYLYTAEKHKEYQIDALREPIVINFTELSRHLTTTTPFPSGNTRIRLWRVTLFLFDPMTKTFTPYPTYQNVSVDGGPILVNVPYDETSYPGDFRPYVDNSISLTYPTGFSYIPLVSDQSQLFLNFSFSLEDASTGLLIRDNFINNSYNSQNNFTYGYDPALVTQPRLEPGVVDVAVW